MPGGLNPICCTFWNDHSVDHSDISSSRRAITGSCLLHCILLTHSQWFIQRLGAVYLTDLDVQTSPCEVAYPEYAYAVDMEMDVGGGGLAGIQSCDHLDATLEE